LKIFPQDYIPIGVKDSGIYIGRELSDIKDDETMGHFKKETQALIDKLPIEDKQCSIITEGWYNG
jgi:hypothetical protein